MKTTQSYTFFLVKVFGFFLFFQNFILCLFTFLFTILVSSTLLLFNLQTLLLLLCSVTFRLYLSLVFMRSHHSFSFCQFWLLSREVYQSSLRFFYLICEELAFCVLFLRFMFGSVIHFTIISIMGKKLHDYCGLFGRIWCTSSVVYPNEISGPHRFGCLQQMIQSCRPLLSVISASVYPCFLYGSHSSCRTQLFFPFGGLLSNFF